MKIVNPVYQPRRMSSTKRQSATTITTSSSSRSSPTSNWLHVELSSLPFADWISFIYLNSLKLSRIVAIGASIRAHMADQSIDLRLFPYRRARGRRLSAYVSFRLSLHRYEMTECRIRVCISGVSATIDWKSHGHVINAHAVRLIRKTFIWVKKRACLCMHLQLTRKMSTST